MPLDLDNSSQDQISDIDVDALLNQSEPAGIPMGDEAPEQAAAPAATAPTQEIEFTYNGKPIKAPITDPRIKQWASQGYDYAQRMAAINQEREAFLNEKKTYDERYKPIDDYVRENPSWWDHVQKTWEEKSKTPIDPNDPLGKEFHSLKNELNELKKFKQEILSERDTQRIAKEEAELDQEIKSTQEAYADVDFNAVDQAGKSLMSKVVDHAVKYKMPFKAAFRDFYHDELLKRAEERGKESVAKEMQKKSKLGLLGTTQAPTKGVQSAQDHRGKSYDQLAQEALDELGIAY